MEDYFAQSFRLKVTEWLQLPVQSAMPDGTRIIMKNRERIRVSGASYFPAMSRSDDILVVEGNLQCGAGCTFQREILVRKDARIGDGSKLQALAVDGDAILGNKVQITRWVDSRGIMEIGAGSIVRARATAGQAIFLGAGAQVGSAFAPVVTTLQKEPESPDSASAPTLEITLPGSDSPEVANRELEHIGLERGKLSMLNQECWLYAGDFCPSAPLRVARKLIVKGDCFLPAGSVVESDLKAEGLIELGARVVCNGNVIAAGDIHFGPRGRFKGVLHAGKCLELGAGVFGENNGSLVAAFSTETLKMGAGVVVHGKVASGAQVVVTDIV